jgi:sensor histidine kinase YesM
MTLSFIALSLFVRRMINRMNTNLNRNIERVHEFEIKQKESELSELQAKFNPHFLYNTLEMLRGKARENGDETTAELITQLASIFRGHIGIKTFIPFKEELTFSRHYLALLRARYGDRTRVLYDIDTGLLNYGIIHNTLQILIENYFVHGFNALNGDNRILFRGKSIDEKTMLITVEDNGNGMDDGNIEKLNAALDENTTQRTESYGLKNLHQRLKLFYGPGCGLHITKNRDQGLRVEIRLSKITVREYEEHGIKSASES